MYSVLGGGREESNWTMFTICAVLTLFISAQLLSVLCISLSSISNNFVEDIFIPDMCIFVCRLYYEFVNYSTIGFGDLVPEDENSVAGELSHQISSTLNWTVQLQPSCFFLGFH